MFVVLPAGGLGRTAELAQNGPTVALRWPLGGPKVAEFHFGRRSDQYPDQYLDQYPYTASRCSWKGMALPRGWEVRNLGVRASMHKQHRGPTATGASKLRERGAQIAREGAAIPMWGVC